MTSQHWNCEGEGESVIYKWGDFEVRPVRDECGINLWGIFHRGNDTGTRRPVLDDAMQYCVKFQEDRLDDAPPTTG